MNNTTKFILNKSNANLEQHRPSKRMFCVCCFGKNLNYINLANCQHIKVLQCILNLQVNYLCLLDYNIYCHDCQNIFSLL